MAPRRKAAAVEVEEVDELDELDDLEDLADDEEDVEEDVEEEDEDEAPVRKKKTTKKKVAKKVSTTFGSAELAEALDTSGRELRVMLRQKKIAKNENNRYEWEDLDSALEDLGFDDVDEAQEALAESRTKRLDELKERVGATKKKTPSKKKSTTQAEEVDEYEVDEDDDEEEEPAPKPKRKTTRRK